MSFDRTTSAAGKAAYVDGPEMPPTPLGTVAMQLGNADALANRVSQFVNRLLGSVPECDTDATGRSVDGKLYELEGLARRTGSSVDAAHEALTRLEGHF